MRFQCHCPRNPDGKAQRMRPPARIPARRGGGESRAAGRRNPRGTDVKAQSATSRAGWCFPEGSIEGRMFVACESVAPYDLDTRRPALLRTLPLPIDHAVARAMHAAMTRAWLIGAGPGDVELMTLKATRALAQADVVLVDDLVNRDVLQFARADALVLYVGKRGGHPSTPQAGIVAQMLEHVRAGRSVARLKGGDPFVFGRGGEELQALHAAGIDVEVINGVTAGIAAPAAI